MELTDKVSFELCDKNSLGLRRIQNKILINAHHRETKSLGLLDSLLLGT